MAIAKKRAFGIFTSRKATEQAINELKTSGFPMEKVSVIAKQAEANEQLSGVTMSDRVGNRDVDATGAVGDAVTSATWGTILVGLTIAHNKKTSQSRCVGTRHQRYLR